MHTNNPPQPPPITNTLPASFLHSYKKGRTFFDCSYWKIKFFLTEKTIFYVTTFLKILCLVSFFANSAFLWCNTRAKVYSRVDPTSLHCSSLVVVFMDPQLLCGTRAACGALAQLLVHSRSLRCTHAAAISLSRLCPPHPPSCLSALQAVVCKYHHSTCRGEVICICNCFNPTQFVKARKRIL